MSDKEDNIKLNKSFGELLILDVNLYILNNLDGKYSSLYITGTGTGPGDTYQKRMNLIKSGIKIGCEIYNKEHFLKSCKKKFDTVLIVSSLGTVRDKKEFFKNLKRITKTVIHNGDELDDFTKISKIKIGKLNYNIFKNKEVIK